MCNNCGFTICNCEQKYSYNWYNVDNYPCNPCTTKKVCKKSIPAECTIFTGPNLSFIGLTSDINIQIIISSIVNTLSAIQATQDQKNIKIQDALTDINQRIISITGVSHPNYII